MSLDRCIEIASKLTDEDFAVFCVARRSGEEVVEQYTASTAFRINDPCEPMLAVFENGSWQVAYDGDIQWMSDGAPIHNGMVNAIPLKAILEDLERFLMIDRQNHVQ